RFVEMFLRAEITGLNEIDDAPKIEQPILQRRASQSQPLIRIELLHRLRDLRRRILDELRFIEHHSAEREFLQRLEVTAQQSVIRDNDVVLRNLFSQI